MGVLCAVPLLYLIQLLHCCIQCKPDPLALERAQAFLKKCREEAQKQGVSGGDASSWHMSQLPFLRSMLAGGRAAAEGLPALSAPLPWGPCLLNPHPLSLLKLTHSPMQVADVKLATLVTCVGGAADTGRHIVDYSRRQDADVVLMGSRGMGSLRRAMLGLLGLGSVSSYGEGAVSCGSWGKRAIRSWCVLQNWRS